MKIRYTAEKGNGVFADKRYPAGALVLKHEILVIPSDNVRSLADSFIDNYAFYIKDVYFIALGVASLINHDDNPNLYYTFSKRTRQIEFYSLRAIRKGEELTIDYEWESYPWKKKAQKRTFTPTQRL